LEREAIDSADLTPASRWHVRSIALIAFAVLVIGGASLAYLRPLSLETSPSSTQASSSLLTKSGDVVTYDFVSGSLGWALEVPRPSAAAVAQFWIFRTVDGGNHWQRQLAGQQGSSSHTSTYAGGTLSIQFLDAAHGFVAIGYPIELYRTLDGGTHWNAVQLPRTQVDVVTFSDSSHGWFLASTPASPNPILNLYKTSDAGVSWQQLPDPPFDSIRMTFRSMSEGWIGATGPGQPHVYFSADGGRSWRRRDLPEPPGTQDIATIVRLLPGTGVITAVSRSVTFEYSYTTFDRGASWKPVPHRPDEVFAGGESFVDALHWWVIDHGVLFKSSDAGQTWKPASQPLENGQFWLYLVHVIDPMDAWAEVDVGEVSGLALTHDGGLHWARVVVPVTT
jgi:photosystem II stability/assembly factor-like uncharacterized protein